MLVCPFRVPQYISKHFEAPGVDTGKRKPKASADADAASAGAFGGASARSKHSISKRHLDSSPDMFCVSMMFKSFYLNILAKITVAR